jgi:hypothetical protein
MGLARRGGPEFGALLDRFGLSMLTQLFAAEKHVRPQLCPDTDI